MSDLMESSGIIVGIHRLKDLVLKQKAKQVASLYTSMVFGFCFSFVASIVNTRFLGPQQYGDLKFLQNVFNICATCLTFGYFTTGSTLLAQRKNDDIRHELFGNLLFVAALLSVPLMAGLFVFSYFEEGIFNNQLGGIIRLFSPLLFVYLFLQCLEKILIGDNRIYQLSIFKIAPSALYLVGAVLFQYFVGLTLLSALAIQLTNIFLVIVLTVGGLKPNLHNIKENFRYIWKENKSYGFQVYIGILAAVVSGQLANIWIAYFMENIYVGFFSLALTITLPLAMIPNAVSSTFFKDYANNSSIPGRVIWFTSVTTVSLLAIYFLIIDKVIIFVYSTKFSAVTSIVYLIAVGSTLHGFGDLFNRFLGAHGRGRVMRNGAIIVGLTNLIGYFAFVKYFGIKGAAVINAASSFVYFCVRYYPYRKLVIELRSS